MNPRGALALVGALASMFVVFIGLASCAAIGGLGDFTEVDCVGACDGSAPEAAVEGSDGSTTDASERLAFANVGGTVTGLVGKGLILKNNGADDLQISTDGPFVFPAKVRDGAPYVVTVSAQPSDPSQTCSVTKGAGNVDGADVKDVTITCSTSSFAVGGTVVGLTGTGLVLTNNGADDLPAPANGPFTFVTHVASGSPFAVAVKTQPNAGGPCAVSGGSGVVGVADVKSAVVNCAPGTYTVGGTVSGLVGTVVLQDNGGSDLTLTSNGSFAFLQTLMPGATYAVTVSSQPGYPPRAQTCTVTSGTGTMGSANVTSVAVTCVTKSFTVGGTVSGLSGTLVLKNNGADNLTLNASGGFTFATSVASGNAFAVTVGTQPSGQTCSVTSGSGTMGGANVTNVAVACAGGAGVDPGIRCGAAYCDPASQLCCVTNGTPACATKCTGGGTVQITCDDAQDCATAGTPALICCGSVTNNIVNAIYCTQPSLCSSPKVLFCDSKAANPCPNGGTCTAATVPAGYESCK